MFLALALIAAQAPPAASIVADPAADVLELKAGPDVVARYQYRGTVAAEKGAGRKPLAKPFFYPLLAPNGVAVTRAWPLERGVKGETTDHVHQKSVWFCHGDVIPDGVTWTPKSADPHVKGVDFWSEAAGHGVIRCDAVDAPVQVSPTHARVATRNRWLTPDGQTLLTEVRTIHLHLLPRAGGGGRLIVVESDLTAAVPVTFGDTKEGSFGVRVPDSFALNAKGGTGVVTSSNGDVAKAPAKDNLPVWGRPADWHDYSGTAGGKTAGVAVFDAPTNPHRAAWHTRAYGLMAANPFARAGSGFPGRKASGPPAKLAKGESLRLRYGVYAHDGDAAGGKVAAAYAAFAGLPAAR